MAKMKTQFNYSSPNTYVKSFQGKQYGLSKTKPNMSYTVRELVDMHRKGISPEVLKKALWEMEDLGEEMNPLRAKNLDLTDIDRVIAEVKIYQDKIEAEAKKSALARKKAEKEAIIQEYLNEKDKNKDGIHDDKTPSNESEGA